MDRFALFCSRKSLWNVIFENVITLINKNEKVIENNANIFDYNDNAKLKVTGFSPINDPLIPLVNDKGEEQKDKNGNIIMTKILQEYKKMRLF